MSCYSCNVVGGPDGRLYVHIRAGFVTSQLVWKPIMVQNAIYTSAMWKSETSSTHAENRLFSKVGDMLCPAVRESVVDVILRILNKIIELCCGKTISEKNYHSK